MYRGVKFGFEGVFVFLVVFFFGMCVFDFGVEVGLERVMNVVVVGKRCYRVVVGNLFL